MIALCETPSDVIERKTEVHITEPDYGYIYIIIHSAQL